MNRADFTYFTAALAFLCSLVALTMFGVARGDEPDPECQTPTHCVLMSFPRFYMDANEDDEARSLRLLANANAIDAATDRRDERALLIMKAWKESRLARFVDLDLPRCREGIGGWCDGGRSFSVFQVRGLSRDSSRVDAAKYALEAFKRGANYCRKRGHGYWMGGVAMYATGNICRWHPAKERVDFMWSVFARLGRAGG